MKKKPVISFALAILTFSLTSCSLNKPSTDEEPNATKEEVTAPDGMSDNLYDAQFSIGGVIYQLPMKCSDFDANIFISEYDYEKMLYSEAQSPVTWNYGDIRLSGMAVNPSVNGNPLKDCYVTSLDINNYKNNVTDIFFAKGIQMNVSSEKDIINAYGEPTKTSEYDDDLYMYYETYENLDNPIFFIVDMETDTLTAVRLQIRELPVTDYTINSEVPYIADYIAPTEFSDNLDCSILRLNENYYSLPCPVTELIDNGFKQNDYMSQTTNPVIPAGAIEECIFALDNKYLNVTVKNYTYYATSPENCYIISVEDNSYYDNNAWAMEIAPGLKVGDSEDELLSELENIEYKTNGGTTSEGKEKKSYDWYEYNDSNTIGGTRNFSIEVSEGKIISISISNSILPTYKE